MAVRLRRDFTAILNLIEAHALLHQANRKKDKQGRVIAALADYRAVQELINDIVSQGVEQTVSKTIRQTVEAVGQICGAKEKTGKRIGDEQTAATVKGVAERLGIDRSAASRRVKDAVGHGYLKNLETKLGQPHRLVVADPLPEEEKVMPTPEEVLKKWKAVR